MSKSESKYFNTDLLMDEALVLLLEKKSFEFITIKEICLKAGVNRSTFYLHYENTSDLLKECLEYVNNEFTKQFPTSTTVDVDNLPLDELLLINDRYLLPYLQFVKEHVTFYKSIYNHPEVFGTANAYERLTSRLFYPILDRYHVSDEDKPYMIEYYIKGMTSLIMMWANNGCKEDIQHIADLIKSLVGAKK